MRFGLSLMALSLIPCWNLLAQGSLVYVSHHQGNLASDPPQLFDLNQDGRPDLSVSAVYQQFESGGTGNYGASLLGGTRMVTDQHFFSTASLLPAGTPIDSSTIPLRTSREAPPHPNASNNWVDQATSLGVSLGGASDDGLGNRSEWGVVGTAGGLLGLQLYNGEEYFNAWLRIESIPLPSGGNHYRVADWAYNTIPDVPILAGITQVPEPNVATLFCSGLACVLAAVAFTFLPGRLDKERPLEESTVNPPPSAQP